MTNPTNANASLAGEANAEGAEVGGLHGERSTVESSMCEVEQAQHFLTLLDETAEVWHFRTFPESGSGKGRNRSGALSDIGTMLELDNGNGRGVFVVVNDGGQDEKHITRVRAVFADFDPPKTSAMPATFPLEPHVIIESSPGKHHAYWVVDGLPLEQFKPLQQAIASKFGSDPAVCDLPRVMRLPGFMHRKGEAFRSRIIHESGALPYSADAIREAFVLAPSTPARQPAPAATHGPSGVVVDTDRHMEARGVTARMARAVAEGMSEETAWAAILAERDRGRWTRHLPDDELRRLFDGALVKLRSGEWKAPELPAVAANDAHLVAVDLGAIMGTMPPAPRFIIDPLVPRRVATLLGGHGGLGKSMLGLTLCAHIAAGRAWAGFPVAQARAVFVSLEDEAAIVAYRLRRIIERYALPAHPLLDNLRVFDGTDVEAALMVEANDRGVTRLVETPMLAEVEQAAASAGFVVLDNASDAYGGNENTRLQVRAFMRRLARIAKANDAGLILLAHVDKDAAKHGAKGNSYSGSTAWHNSARSRLALVHDDGVTELRHEKANLGKKAEPVRLQCVDHGVLVPAAGDESREAAAAVMASADAAAVLEVLQIALQAGATITTASAGPATTWHMLAAFPELGKVYRTAEGRRRVLAALVALERQGRIVRTIYQKPNRHQGERWALADASVAAA